MARLSGHPGHLFQTPDAGRPDDVVVKVGAFGPSIHGIHMPAVGPVNLTFAEAGTQEIYSKACYIGSLQTLDADIGAAVVTIYDGNVPATRQIIAKLVAASGAQDRVTLPVIVVAKRGLYAVASAACEVYLQVNY